MQDSFLFEQTIDAAALALLAPGETLVLTVNNRLARRLTQDLAARLSAETDGNRRVSELARIMPLSAWLADAAQGLSFLPGPSPKFRLSSFGSQRLWMQTIEAEEAERSLMDVGQAARLAMDADVLMDEWALNVPDAAVTEEFSGFQRWRKTYRARMRQLDAEDTNLGYAHVLAALKAGRITPPPHVVLAGFTETSPRFAQLRDAFVDAGSQLFQLSESLNLMATPLRHPADDKAAEWRAAAGWAKQALDENPKGRYAIVSPHLEAEVPFARRVLDESLRSAAGTLAHPVNIAVARALVDWPQVHAALAWARALDAFSSSGFCSPSLAGAALLAGYHFDDQFAAGGLAANDVRWRKQARLRVSEAEFVSALHSAPRLLTGWRDAITLWQSALPEDLGTETSAVQSPSDRRNADQWSIVFRRAFSALGFPGTRHTDSVTFQVIGAFSDMLDDFAALTPVGREMNGAQAISLLEQLARVTLFQPQRDPLARLDVLGMLEAEGGRWDGVWVLGLTDDVLPASPKPNPLIPLAVLRQANAPRATPARERQWAHDVFDALCRTAPQVWVSHALREGERELRPSPLISAFDIAPTLLLADSPDLSAFAGVDHVGLLEHCTDDRGPPLAEGVATRGGLDVLDTQARNPLWAFVRHRLGGQILRPYAELASVNVRGQFLHRALEIAWGSLSGQEALHDLIAGGTLPDFVAQCVAQAALELLVDYDPVLNALEQARACQVVLRWMDVEAQRTPFEIGEVESKIVWTRGPLALTVRLDRLDRVPEGCVIVDYKTGSAPQSFESDWARVRPINVQLPFYASVVERGETADPVVGLVLAQIHARRIVAAGLVDVDIGLADVKSLLESKHFEGLTWPALLDRWRTSIHGLADEYAAGWASNTTWRATDLQYCDAMPFLRLHLDLDDE